MLTEQIEEMQYDEKESPTFGVVDDGRKYPAVTARRRQQHGSKRETLYTVSKNGKYSYLYEQFERDVIEPYRERKRKRAVDGRRIRVNTPRPVEIQIGEKSPQYVNRRDTDNFPVNSVDGRS